MIKKIILAAIILSLVLVGCQKAPVEREETTPAETNMDKDMSEVDALDEDLNLDELENVEAELDEINW